jgi:HEAT repeat protein
VFEVVITLRYLNQLTHFSPANLLAKDSDKEVRKETMLTLGNFREECIVGILCDSLQNDESWEVRRNAAIALEIHADHHSSQPLSCAISDVHWQVRKFSMRALSKVLSEEYLKYIIPLLCDEYSDVRKEAAIALGLLGSKDAVAPLKQSLDDADIEVRIASQKALKKIE